LNSLKRWSELNRSAITAPAYTQLNTRQHSPFLHREDINSRFVLWEGDISLLNADAIVNTTNERLNDNNAVSNRIVSRAGTGLLDELKSIKGNFVVNHVAIISDSEPCFLYFCSLSCRRSCVYKRTFTASSLRNPHSLPHLQ
jgi:hypothetical protein